MFFVCGFVLFVLGGGHGVALHGDGGGARGGRDVAVAGGGGGEGGSTATEAGGRHDFCETAGGVCDP